MGITGNLGTMELAELLQWLSGARKTGTLHLESADVTKRVAFRDGRVVASWSNDPKEQIGGILLTRGYVDVHQLGRAVETQTANGGLLGEILVDAGILSPDELDRVLYEKAEEILYEIFTWPAGEFRFEDGEMPPEETMVAMSLDVGMVVLEGARRLDERRRIEARLPSFEAIPVAVGAFAIDRMGDGDDRILSEVDDQRTISEIARAARATEHQVARAVIRQADVGRIKVVLPRLAPAAPAPQAASRRPQAQAAPPRPANGPLDSTALLAEAERRLDAGRPEAAERWLRAAKLVDVGGRVAASGLEARIRAAIRKDAFGAGDVPKLARSLDELSKLRLTPQEGFLISRIDGKQTVETLLRMGPGTAAETQALLRKLVDDGHVQVETKS